MNHRFLTPLLLITLCIFGSAYADDTDLLIEHAWIAEAPPVSKVMAAYMTINNTGSEAVAITKAESALYSNIEFHESVQNEGMARMIRHRELYIPANSSIQLKHGAKHFMLFNPTKRLKAGDTVNIKLTTKNNRTKIISVPVKKAQY
ncbi:MAG: copper chaperone PCu(A)C [Gammaproteobacteria bacterium]